MVLPEDARKGHRVQEDRRRQLGSGRPDGARQRAGDRRHAAGARARRSKSARSRCTTCGSRITPTSCSTISTRCPAGPSACERCRRTGSARARGVRFAFPHDMRDGDGQAHRRRQAVRVHHARRHDHGRHVLRGRGRASARDARGAARIPTLAAFIDECRRGGVDRSRPGDDGKEGHAHRALRHASADRRQDRGLGRQLRADELRRRRGDGRAGARRARLRVREEVRAADQAGDRDSPARRSRPTRWQPWYEDKARGRCVNSGKYDGLAYAGGGRRDRRRPRREGAGREEDHVPPARLGHLAPALLGHADPDHPLPGVRRRAGAGEGSAGGAAGGLRARRQRQSAREARGFRRHDVPEMRQDRRSARPTRWTRSSIRPGTTCATRVPTRGDEWSTRATTTGCRWTSTSAASSTRSCTCSTRASGPR